MIGSRIARSLLPRYAKGDMTAVDQICADILPEYKAAQITFGNIAAGYKVFVDQVLHLDPIAGTLAGMVQAVLPFLYNSFKSLLCGEFKQRGAIVKYPRYRKSA